MTHNKNCSCASEVCFTRVSHQSRNAILFTNGLFDRDWVLHNAGHVMGTAGHVIMPYQAIFIAWYGMITC